MGIRTGKPRSSPIWLLPRSDFIDLLNRSSGTTEVLKFFGLRNVGRNSHTLWRRVDEEGLDRSELKQKCRRASQANLDANRKLITLTLDDMMVENSPYSRQSLKKLLIKSGTLMNRCSECGLGTEWRGKPLVLRLDHINGVANDDRPGNHRLVCPNCDSQLPTFAGRNNLRRKRHNCRDCGKILESKGSTRCKPCNLVWLATIPEKQGPPRRYKIEWPTPPELIDLVGSLGYLATGKLLGVSDVAVRKALERMKVHSVVGKLVTPPGFGPGETEVF